MANFYSVKKSNPYSIKATKKASAYTSNKKQNNVYSNSIGLFDKEYVVIPSSVPGATSSTPVVIPVVPVATAPSVAPSTVPAEPTTMPEEPKQVPADPKQSSSKKKNGIIIALAVLAAAAILFIPGKKK